MKCPYCKKDLVYGLDDILDEYKKDWKPDEILILSRCCREFVEMIPIIKIKASKYTGNRIKDNWYNSKPPYIWLKDKPQTIVQIWYCNKRKLFFIYDPTSKQDVCRILYRQIYVYKTMNKCQEDELIVANLTKIEAVKHILSVQKLKGKTIRGKV